MKNCNKVDHPNIFTDLLFFALFGKILWVFKKIELKVPTGKLLD